jgi:hypothetical protein
VIRGSQGRGNSDGRVIGSVRRDQNWLRIQNGAAGLEGGPGVRRWGLPLALPSVLPTPPGALLPSLLAGRGSHCCSVSALNLLLGISVLGGGGGIVLTQDEALGPPESVCHPCLRLAPGGTLSPPSLALALTGPALSPQDILTSPGPWSGEHPWSLGPWGPKWVPDGMKGWLPGSPHVWPCPALSTRPLLPTTLPSTPTPGPGMGQSPWGRK